MTPPGLVHLHGAPLDSLSSRAKTFISKVRDVNESVMRLVARDPDIVHRPRTAPVEEICAEMFTRLAMTSS